MIPIHEMRVMRRGLRVLASSSSIQPAAKEKVAYAAYQLSSFRFSIASSTCRSRFIAVQSDLQKTRSLPFALVEKGCTCAINSPTSRSEPATTDCFCRATVEGCSKVSSAAFTNAALKRWEVRQVQGRT
jgi:hypothetical protein